MRHRRKGRVLGRSPSHQRALLRNLASALFLTERDATDEDNEPKTKGRIVTTLPKAKEVRPLVERCITIAIRSLKHAESAQAFSPPVGATGTPERTSEAYLGWRRGGDYAKWRQAMAPVVNARRRVFSLLRDQAATRLCFEEIAPRFVDRPGGYTRIVRLAKPRLGDAGTRAVLEFVGVRDRTVQKAQAPQVESEPAPAT
jgi:large subunit ribosomal protein L17